MIFMLSWLVRHQLSYSLKITTLLTCTYLIIFSALLTIGPTANSKAGVIVMLLMATIFLDQPAISLVFAAIVMGLITVGYLAVHQLIDFSGLDSQAHNAVTWLNMGVVLLAGSSVAAWVARSMMNELARCRKIAEEANQAKTQFLTNVSHELRTPLNVILGFSKVLLEQGDNLTPAQQQHLSMIANSGNSLHRLVTDVIDLERAESGRFKLQKKSVFLSGLINEVTEMVNHECERKGLLLQVEIPSLNQHLLIDGERLKQILLNLLSNAIKFTERGTVQLKVEAAMSGEQQIDLKIAVTDTGIGIAPADQMRIFSPFEQVKQIEDAQSLGLGLTICQQLAQLMGGELTLQSAIGRGSCFTLNLPGVSVVPKEQQPFILPPFPISTGFSAQDLPLAADVSLLCELAEFRMFSEIEDWLQANNDSYPGFCSVLNELVTGCDLRHVEQFLNTLPK